MSSLFLTEDSIFADMLQATDLTYAYGNQAELQFPDITCKRGAHWLILGDSGSGKTTLLHLLGGLLRPKAGQIEIADTLINKLSTAALDKFRGKHIGIIFQQSHFVQAITVEENLYLAQHLAGVKKDKDRVQAMLERLNIGHKANEKPKSLSQGEQQRVAIARALVNRPELILADEPTSALDDTNCFEVLDLIETEASAANATLLIVTHDGRLKDKIDKKIILT